MYLIDNYLITIFFSKTSLEINFKCLYLGRGEAEIERHIVLFECSGLKITFSVVGNIKE